VVLGDELAMDIALADGSVLLTTPSAGRFYGVGSFQERQVQRVRLSVQAGELAWLPQETLVFAGANAQLDTHIDLGPAAQLCYWDLIVLGQPAGGQRFDRGCLQQNLEVCRGGRPLLRERLALHAGDRFSQSPIGLDGCSTFGIFLCTDALVEERVDHWLALVNGAAPGAFTFSRRDGLSIARYRGEDAAQGRRGFAALWESIEIARSGRAPAIPRVWHT
jgi:urease accessory protein